jgi:hypothetical protein
MKEIWKNIKNYEGLYQISSYGKVKSLRRKRFLHGKPINIYKQKFLKHGISLGGYYVVNLYKDSKRKMYRINRLVAIHFISNPLNKPEVNHLDGNKKNNYYKNLEWVTRVENEKHAYKIGLKDIKGEKHWFAKLGEKDILFIRNNRNNFKQKELARMFFVDQSTISSILNNKTWSHI